MRPIAYNHPVRIAWNILILCAILAFLFIITYRVVFAKFTGDLFYYALNGLFVFDIGFNFVTKVKLGHMRLETLPEIRRHYLRGWFTIDVIAAFPFEIALLAMFGGIPTDTAGLFVYFLFQALTLIKLLKVGRIFKELEEALDIIPALRRLVLFGYGLAASLHIVVLGWIMIGGTEQNRLPFDQYLRGLYWVVTTIATIGYGDYYPNHDSNIQIVYTIIVELFGVGMFSYVIANVSSLVTNLDIARSSHQRRLEEVNAYMRAQRIPPDLQERVRDYYSYLWTKQRGVDATNVLEDMPVGLSQEILLFLNRDILSRVSIFKDANELFIRESVRLMKPQVFLPGEYIIRQGEFADCMYFLASGEVRIVINGNDVARLGPGSPFGETALIDNQHRNASVISDSYGTGYRLDKDDFNELRAKYPEFDRQVEAIARSRNNANMAKE
jgi:cAMP-binding proteins - catabolite gene activator and regulatory subunit of cAMP-dependent protein kinases